MLAASVSGGTLSIPGTSAADVVMVGRDGTDLVVTTNGVVQRFAASTLTAITSTLGAGNDSIAIDDAVTIPSTLSGEAGDDTLRGGSGDDSLDGGDGADTQTYAGRPTAITGYLDGKTEEISDGQHGGVDGEDVPPTYEIQLRATVDADDGEHDASTAIETLVGGEGNDVLYIVIGQPSFFPDLIGGTSLMIAGGAGNDQLTLAYTDDALSGLLVADGGEGNDRIEWQSIGDITVRGGDGDDQFDGFLGNATGLSIDAGDGDDRLQSEDNYDPIDFAMPEGLEVFTGGTAAATVTGNAADNTIEIASGSVDGGGGDDRITATSGASRLVGGNGDDTIYGSTGNDTISGGSGRDRLWGRDGDDRLDGGSSNDQLRGEGGDDILDGRAGNDRLDGGDGDDVLRGEENDDALYGRDGDDTLDGSTGDDRLDAGAGADQLDGGAGRDTLYGGDGADGGFADKRDRIVKEIEMLT